MAYRIYQDDKLGPHIAGEPDPKKVAMSSVRDVLGAPWVPVKERDPELVSADASVEAKLANKDTEPKGVYVNAVAGKRHAERHVEPRHEAHETERHETRGRR